ncbi:hypothetical protein MH117_10685 [Paenibacillus sp. ACRRX]|nr:hypothetical protein [Paenibacillus sp. ACRRX]MCG7407887.1 hypothetical protein [Paenibacillus sp. ACRRX]MDK8181030.1 hypothetical protein [Paenibacillus sp. UMB4589-SE434]
MIKWIHNLKYSITLYSKKQYMMSSNAPLLDSEERSDANVFGTKQPV